MKTQETIPKDLIAQVEDKLIEVYLHAQAIWNRVFDLPSVAFDLKGRAAGSASYRGNRVRFNAVLLEENTADFLERTVPHEAAHLLAHAIYCGTSYIKPHGAEWKSVMLALGVEPRRCHDYDLTDAQVRRERRFAYRCNCRTIHASARTHNRIQRGELHGTCPFCQSEFTWQKQEEAWT